MQIKPLIVITGASSGFGAEIAKQLSALGHPLLLLARRLDKLEALNLPNAICKGIDIYDHSALAAALLEAEAVFGDVDCLINNAGIMLLGNIENQNHEEWASMFQTNVLALLKSMQLVMAGMKHRKHGTIINISSVAGYKSFEHHAAYSGTKFAVHGISDTVRWELAPYNVRVITISPGAAETELLSHTSSPEIKQDYENWKTSIGGVISAYDVAKTVVFAYSMPQDVCIRELVVAPTRQQN